MNPASVAGRADAQWWAVACALLRGESCQWPSTGESVTVQAGQWKSFLSFHGIDALLAESLAQLHRCPEAIVVGMKAAARSRAAWELRHKALLQDLTRRLQAAGIHYLLFKGTALAYSLYRNPVWRARVDTDVLIAESDSHKAIQVLRQMGFSRPELSGEGVVTQLEFHWLDEMQNLHAVDLHWQFSNSPLISRHLGFNELARHAVSLERQGLPALIPSTTDALLVACVHRAMHQQETEDQEASSPGASERLIWIYDIDQLARRLSQPEWLQFVSAAVSLGVAHTCRRGLLLARTCLGTPVPDEVESMLQAAHSGACDLYLRAGRLKRGWQDLLANKGVRNKLRYSCKLLFPPREYMQEKYRGSTISWLPFLYFRRAATGLLARLPGQEKT